MQNLLVAGTDTSATAVEWAINEVLRHPQTLRKAKEELDRGRSVMERFLINTWSIGRDPKSWDAPEKFLPERFMGKEFDALGSNFSFLPFGSGRRRCPGYNLALRMVPTTFANLLHGFDFKLVEGMKPQDICMEEEYGLTTHPKLHLSIIMEPTLPLQLY
ncbi:hypothetical protein ACS0TY_027925 [Phlomoides rotata]